MSEFEQILVIFIIPIVYIMAYIAGKYDFLALICKMLEEKASEIVKQGGVSDDVCEWKSDYGFISDKYKRETGCGYTFYDLHHAVPFKYCPYCGKKIKVVE